MRLDSPPRLVAFLLAALAPTWAFGGEGSNSPVGDARLPSGLAAHYEYHYDRNALLDSRSVGDVLIALTRSGNLLRFDAKTLEPAGEWFGPVAATCLGRGEGDAVLAGFADGRVCRVDPTTLALDPVARVDGEVRWVGWSPGGLVVVAEPSVMKEWTDGVRRPTRYSVVHDLASGKTYKLTQKRRDPESGEETAYDRRASAFLLDGKRRLWLGADRGERGGWCVRIDLGAGTATDVEGIKDNPEDRTLDWDSVYGFFEMPDGQVWAHGGTMQMGFLSAFLRRVDGPKVEPLYLYSNLDAQKGRKDDEETPVPERPCLPITHILPDRDGKLLVFSYSYIYRGDPGLKAWSKAFTMEIRYRPGRPDSLGLYPSVVAAHQLGDRLVCATAVEGYVEVVADEDVGLEAFRHALSGQIGFDGFQRIAVPATGRCSCRGTRPNRPGGSTPAAGRPPRSRRPSRRRSRGGTRRTSWSGRAGRSTRSAAANAGKARGRPRGASAAGGRSWGVRRRT